MIVRRPSGFIEPCLPSKAARPPSCPLWLHEIKHDGYRLMVRRDGSRVRCFTLNSHDWANRFPVIVDAAHRIKGSSFLIDGEGAPCVSPMVLDAIRGRMTSVLYLDPVRRATSAVRAIAPLGDQAF